MKAKRISAKQARELMEGVETVILVHSEILTRISLTAMAEICDQDVTSSVSWDNKNITISEHSVLVDGDWGKTIIKFYTGRYYYCRVDGINYIGYYSESEFNLYRLVYNEEYLAYKKLRDVAAMHRIKVIKASYGYDVYHYDSADKILFFNGCSFRTIGEAKEFVNLILDAQEENVQVTSGSDDQPFRLFYIDKNGLRCNRFYKTIGEAKQGVKDILRDNNDNEILHVGDYTAIPLVDKEDELMYVSDSYFGIKKAIMNVKDTFFIYKKEIVIETINNK